MSPAAARMTTARFIRFGTGAEGAPEACSAKPELPREPVGELLGRRAVAGTPPWR